MLSPTVGRISLFVHPDHLCFDQTAYDNINGQGGTFMFDIIGPARPLTYTQTYFMTERMADRPHELYNHVYVGLAAITKQFVFS